MSREHTEDFPSPGKDWGYDIKSSEKVVAFLALKTEEQIKILRDIGIRANAVVTTENTAKVRVFTVVSVYSHGVILKNQSGQVCKPIPLPYVYHVVSEGRWRVN